VVELFWRAFYFAAQAIVRPFVRVKREGPRLPAGPLLLAANHCSFMDPVVLQAAAWRHLSYLMTDVYYRPWLARWFFAWMRTIPVREGGGSNRAALETAAHALKHRWAVGIFPEGGISKTGELQRFFPGVAALAESTQTAVVPVAILGTFQVLPRHARFPKLFRKVVVRFGEPIPPPRVDDERRRREELRAYTELLHDRVLALQDAARTRRPTLPQPMGACPSS